MTLPSRVSEYWAAGPASAPPIALIHGSRLTRAMWTPQFELLSGEFRLVALDLPGHGALAAVPFTMDAAVARVRATLDVLAIERAIICGLSLGGYVALAFAARYPERTTALVLSGSSYSFRGALGKVFGAPYLVASRLMTSHLAPLLARADERMFRARYPAALAEAIVRGGFFYRPFPAVVAALRAFDPLPALHAYPGPALLLNGAADPIFRRGEHAYLQALACGRLQVIDGAAHLVNLDQPEAYCAALRAIAGSRQVAV